MISVVLVISVVPVVPVIPVIPVVLALCICSLIYPNGFSVSIFFDINHSRNYLWELLSQITRTSLLYRPFSNAAAFANSKMQNHSSNRRLREGVSA